MPGLLRAVADSFGSGMGPMMLTFAALGAALARVCQAARDSVLDARPTRGGGGPFLRICMYCKGIPRMGGDGRDHWVPLEQALYDAEGIEFSHGVCPHCYTEHLEPQINNWKRKKT